MFNVPRETRSYIVENLLSNKENFHVDIILRYQKFYMNLMTSPLLPVRVMSRLLCHDVSSISGSNLAYITETCGQDPLTTLRTKLKEKLVRRRETP